jgi:transcriptional regulator with XRE-family HTH domain
MNNAQPATITLAEIIRIAITRTGLTLAEVGEALDVHEKTVGRWQRGVNTPDFDHVVKLAAMARMPLATFADAVPGVPPTTCYAPHLSLVPELPGQCELDLTGAEPVLRLHAGHVPDRQRAVARRSLAATRLHAVT